MIDPAVAVGDLLRRARSGAGMSQRELARGGETSQAAVARYETAGCCPTCGRSTACSVAAVNASPSTPCRPAARDGSRPPRRPVAIPDDLGDANDAKAGGVVELPPHIRWSGPPRTYDLDQRRDRARVYEQVLREGTEADVRHFVSVDELVDLWDELILPDHVRAAWDRWFRARADAIRC